jgi:transcriptional regulator
MARDKGDLLQGTLGMLILKALTAQGLHGYGIARWIEQITKESLSIEEGSLYPALRRLEDRRWVSSSWALSDTSRRVRVYSLTKQGRQQLRAEAATWMEYARAVTIVLRTEPSFRQLRNAPRFTLSVIAVLALGIGANTAIFSAIDGGRHK